MGVRSAPVNQAGHVEERPAGGVGSTMRVERNQPVADTLRYHLGDRPRGGSNLDRRSVALTGGRAGPISHPVPDDQRLPDVDLGSVIPRGPAAGSWRLLGRSDRVDPYRGLDDGRYRLMPPGPTRPIPALHATQGDWWEDARVEGVRRKSQKQRHETGRK